MISIISAILALASTEAQVSPAWPTYQNVRYGFSACYPRNLLVARPEAPNGDGITLVGAGDVQVIIYGENDVDQEGLAHHVHTASEMYSNSGARVTAERIATKYAILSGYQGTNIFYEKTFARGDQFITISFRYPRSAARTWNPVVESMTRCLSIGQPAY